MPPRVTKTVVSITSSVPSIHNHCSSCSRREFSSTPAANTRLRRRMFAWLTGPGENLRHPQPNTTNYLTQFDRRGNFVGNKDDGEPKLFPLNPNFVSQSILSTSLRQEIWKRVQVENKSVRQVSVELGVEMRRVGAVVRLVELEKRMRAEKQSLALPYAQAIHSMVPTTPYDNNSRAVSQHEPINDLPAHTLTNPQVFYPTSESRAFNRVDAGRVFSGAPRLPDSADIGQGGRPLAEPWKDTKIEIIGKKGHEMAVLKPADARIPHPHLIAFEQDKRNPDLRGEDDEIKQRYAQRLYNDAKDRQELRAKRLAQQESQTTRIETNRWQFVVTEVQTTREGTGLDGRGHRSPGVTYGVPSQDRKRGQVKIPTKVDVRSSCWAIS